MTKNTAALGKTYPTERSVFPLAALLRGRILHGVAVLLAVSIFSFVLGDLVPGDPFSERILNPLISPDSTSSERERLGLDRFVAVRYLEWVASCLRGDLGTSFAYDRPVRDLLTPRLARTALLALAATSASWLVALLWGTWVAADRRFWVRSSFGAVTSSLEAIPDVVLALGLLTLAVFSRSGGLGRSGVGAVMLPFLAVVLAVLPAIARHVEQSVREQLEEPFVRTARSQGFGGSKLLLRVVLPAAANPLASLLGLSFAQLLSVTLVAEVILDWPGIGPLMIEAVQGRDTPVVVGVVTVTALMAICGNLVGDLLVMAVDPRARSRA